METLRTTMMLLGLATVAGGLMASLVSLVERDWTLLLLGTGIVSGGVCLAAFAVFCRKRGLHRQLEKLKEQ